MKLVAARVSGARYNLRDPRAVVAMTAVDWLMQPLASAPRPAPRQPEAILVAQCAHLGDLLIALPTVQALRRRWPAARVGLVCGSWCEPLARTCGLFDDIHCFDHWVHERDAKSRWRRVLAHPRRLFAAADAIRRRHYDLAIDVYGWFGNAGTLLRMAGVPARIGFDSGGFGSMFTRAVPWPRDGRHVGETPAVLLRALEPSWDPGPLQALWPGPMPLAVPGVAAPGYLLAHTGTGAPAREWPEAKWQQLLLALAAAGHRVVVAGASRAECSRAKRLAAAVPGAVDASGDHGWPLFAALVRDAALVVCLESVCAHLASALQRPTVCLFSRETDVAAWAPRNPMCRLVRPAAGSEPVAAIPVRAVVEAVEEIGAATPMPTRRVAFR